MNRKIMKLHHFKPRLIGIPNRRSVIKLHRNGHLESVCEEKLQTKLSKVSKSFN